MAAVGGTAVIGLPRHNWPIAIDRFLINGTGGFDPKRKLSAAWCSTVSQRLLPLGRVGISDFVHHLFIIECAPVRAKVKASWKKANCNQYKSLTRTLP